MVGLIITYCNTKESRRKAKDTKSYKLIRALRHHLTTAATQQLPRAVQQREKIQRILYRESSLRSGVHTTHNW